MELANKSHQKVKSSASSESKKALLRALRNFRYSDPGDDLPPTATDHPYLNPFRTFGCIEPCPASIFKTKTANNKKDIKLPLA